MKKRLLSLIMTIVLGLSVIAGGLMTAGCGKKPAEKPISILAIGSSYLRNSMDQVYPILESLGYDEIILGNIYSSGCKINKHMENIQNDTAFYEYRVVINGTLTAKPVPGSNEVYGGGSHNNGGQCYKMSDALNERDWDYVIINQGATEGHIKETYSLLPDYFDYVKSQAPNAKILFNIPWTLAGDCFKNEMHSHTDIRDAVNACGSGTLAEKQQTQYNMILDCVQTEVVPLNFDALIPQVTVMANCRTSKLLETRITYDPKTYGHATADFGRYMFGLSLVSCVTGEDISDISYKPQTVTNEEKAIAIESVLNALANPNQITQSQYVD